MEDIKKMTSEDSKKIKSAMSKLSLTPPPWAKSIPEEKWLPKMFAQVKQGNVSSN